MDKKKIEQALKDSRVYGNETFNAKEIILTEQIMIAAITGLCAKHGIGRGYTGEIIVDYALEIARESIHQLQLLGHFDNEGIRDPIQD